MIFVRALRRRWHGNLLHEAAETCNEKQRPQDPILLSPFKTALMSIFKLMHKICCCVMLSVLCRAVVLLRNQLNDQEIQSREVSLRDLTSDPYFTSEQRPTKRRLYDMILPHEPASERQGVDGILIVFTALHRI